MTEKKTRKTKTQSAYTQAFNEFINEFSSESDRAAVILGTARLDLSLYHLLQHVLLPNTSRSDDLLDGDSPLSNLSARINICYRLGLISAEVTRCLHLVRKIRNIFAHEASGSSLNAGSHRDRVRELCTPLLKSKAFIKYRDKHFSMFAGASRDFRAAAALLVLRLDGGIDYLKSVKDENSIALLPPSFVEPEMLGVENTGNRRALRKDEEGATNNSQS